MSCYIIKSKLNGLVLDVKKGATAAGAQVITYTEHGKENQLWYDDVKNGTICSKQTGFCLDLDGDTLVVRPFEKDDQNQKWERVDKFIKSRQNSKKVLDIFGGKKGTGAKVGSYDFNGEANQQWEFVIVPSCPSPIAPPPAQHVAPPTYPGGASQPGAKRNCWIVSDKSGKVVDIQGGSTAADAKVILYTKNASALEKHQQWYLDEHGHIRSALNDFVFQNKEAGKKLKMAPHSTNPRGQWTVDGKKIVNRAGECLMLKGDDGDDAVLNSGHYKGSPNQHWTLQYS